MAKKRRGLKGTFSDLQLAVAKSYLHPERRNKVLAIGLGAALVLLTVVAADYFLRSGQLLSNGPLSSNHAGFASDCAACHDPELGVTNDNCSVCHEKHGDQLGVYTFSAHYVYRSNDFRRVETQDGEVPCFACHIEHEGHDAEITRVADLQCTGCHEYGSFGEDHPEFEHAREEPTDAAALTFTHVHHVREVMKRQELVDLEKACLYCHNAQPDGKRFQPIEFDRHCDGCHLTATTTTPRLPIGDPANAAILGVETLDSVRRGGAPGTLWAFYSNPAEFQQAGPRVLKRPVHHRDPWILHNLRALRRTLYPDAGLADLLRSSPDAADHEIGALYEEAIGTLEQYALELRAAPQPEVQADLEKINELLVQLRRDLNDPLTALDETRFLLALGDRQQPAETADQIESLVADLTQPCRQCHTVEAATIRRVQKDQGVMRRAEFNHRAHILQRRCLDCHTEIPILDAIESSQPVAASLDRAEIQNVPAIASCRECHAPELASDRCVACHFFHPNKSRRSELLLYLD